MEKKILDIFERISDMLQVKSTRAYLVLATMVLVIFGIWFSNVGLLSFKNFGDFVFFAMLALILAIYRPGWTFVLFIGTIALESINLAPEKLGITLRPYQFFGFLTIVSLIVRASAKRLTFAFPKFGWQDALPIVLVAGGFVSSLFAPDKGLSFKQTVISASFVALYFLVRIYVQSYEDLKKIVPFFLAGSFLVVAYGIWQNVLFVAGNNSFEVMPGRPNATFAEPDWLGIFVTFVLAAILTVIYELNKKSSVISLPVGKTGQQSSDEQPVMVSPIIDDRLLMTKNFIKLALSYIYLVLIFVTLILTVSRSAWVGAVFVAAVFLKSVLLGSYLQSGEAAQSKWTKLVSILKMRNLQWGGFFRSLRNLAIVAVCSVLLVYIFGLTRFQLFNRAVSTGGSQKITIACENNDITVPDKIEDNSDLAKYGCRHINLENIENEKKSGSRVLEILRPDPNVDIRAGIYRKSIAQIKKHPVSGIGWGSISSFLGTDDRGTGLNASNIFLEVWLGSGLLGILSFMLLLGYILVASIALFLTKGGQHGKSAAIAFVMMGWAAVVIPNMFNSGIFLGFLWVYLAVAVSMLKERETRNKI